MKAIIGWTMDREVGAMDRDSLIKGLWRIGTANLAEINIKMRMLVSTNKLAIMARINSIMARSTA